MSPTPTPTPISELTEQPKRYPWLAPVIGATAGVVCTVAGAVFADKLVGLAASKIPGFVSGAVKGKISAAIADRVNGTAAARVAYNLKSLGPTNIADIKELLSQGKMAQVAKLVANLGAGQADSLLTKAILTSGSMLLLATFGAAGTTAAVGGGVMTYLIGESVNLALQTAMRSTMGGTIADHIKSSSLWSYLGIETGINEDDLKSFEAIKENIDKLSQEYYLTMLDLAETAQRLEEIKKELSTIDFSRPGSKSHFELLSSQYEEEIRDFDEYSSKADSYKDALIENLTKVKSIQEAGFASRQIDENVSGLIRITRDARKPLDGVKESCMKQFEEKKRESQDITLTSSAVKPSFLSRMDALTRPEQLGSTIKPKGEEGTDVKSAKKKKKKKKKSMPQYGGEKRKESSSSDPYKVRQSQGLADDNPFAPLADNPTRKNKSRKDHI